MGGERTAGGRIRWWRDVRLFWVPVAGVFVVLLIHWSSILGNLQRDLGNLQRDMGNLREEVASQRGEIATLRAEMATLRAEFQQEMATIRADLQEQMGDLGQRMTRLETLLEVHLEEHRAQRPDSGNPAPAGP